MALPVRVRQRRTEIRTLISKRRGPAGARAQNAGSEQPAGYSHVAADHIRILLAPDGETVLPVPHETSGGRGTRL